MSTKQLPPLTVARFYVACGYSLAPIPPDGTKSPRVLWTEFQKRKPTEQELIAWFQTGKNGIALIQGEVSGNAELLEFETEETYLQWFRAMEHRGHGDLAESLRLIVYSPGGGVHLYYRHDDEPQGNRTLAKTGRVIEGHKQGSDGMTTLIETRGNGGYVLAPGCPPDCHPSGKTYQLAQGASFKHVPTLTAEERAVVFGVCRELDERPAPVVKTRPSRPIEVVGSGEEGTRPGDDFNERGALDALACLERHGWSVERDYGDWQSLRRPGKSRGSGSATFGYVAPGVLHVFSSNAAPFSADEGNNTYGPFHILTLLDFGGDFGACARFLGNRGYGSPLPARSLDTLAAKPAHRTLPGESKFDDGEKAQEILCIVEGEMPVRYAMRRLVALMRLEDAGQVAWPVVEPSTPERKGEAIVWVGEGADRVEVALPAGLLQEMRLGTISETITRLESELSCSSAREAMDSLLAIDHLFDWAGVYTLHHDYIEKVIGCREPK